MKEIKVIIVVLVLFACGKPKGNFSEIPEIKFESGVLKKSEDKLGNTFNSYSVTLKFTDGNSNVGIKEKESGTGKYVGEYKNNLWIRKYKRQNGKFVVNGTRYYDRIVPLIEGTGSPKEQDGTIEFDLEIRDGKSGEVLQFDFQLIDRELNKSNIVRSGVITLK